jgi:hypothetical protein
MEEKKGVRARRLLDNLHLCFDHEHVRYSLAEPMQRICTFHKELGMFGRGVVAAHRTLPQGTCQYNAQANHF